MEYFSSVVKYLSLEAFNVSIIVPSGCENPKPCQTELTVLEYGLYDGDPVTKVLLQPLTGNYYHLFPVSGREACKAVRTFWLLIFIFVSGRTHQLRVHCSAIGHPIVGDFTYSLGVDNSPYRMMLHAYLLHIPLEPLPHLLVTAEDPFVPEVDPKWVPQRSLRTSAATVEALLEHRKSKEKEREEEKRRKQCKHQRTEEESEEQRRVCQEWLSEWAGDWWRVFCHICFDLFLHVKHAPNTFGFCLLFLISKVKLCSYFLIRKLELMKCTWNGFIHPFKIIKRWSSFCSSK